MVIQPKSLRNNLKNLFFDSEGMAWIDDEASRLGGLLSGITGYPTMPTGGEALKDIYGTIPEIGWERLVREFMQLPGLGYTVFDDTFFRFDGGCIHITQGLIP